MIGGSPAKYILDFGGDWIDIRPYFFVALSADERSRKYIEDQYQKKKWLYFSHYQKSDFRTHSLLQCYPVKMEKAIKMVIGIYEEAEASNNHDVLLAISKFAYRDLYRFIEQKRMFDEDEYQSFFKRRTKGGMLNTREYVHSMFVAVFLCFTFSKNFGLGLETASAMSGIIQTPNTPEQRQKMWEKNEGQIREKLEAVHHIHHLDEFKSGDSVWEMHAKEMTKVENLFKEGRQDESDLPEQVNQRMSTLIFFGDVLEAAGIDPIEVQTERLSEEEFRSILIEYTRIVDEYPASQLHFNQAFPAVFYIRQLAKMYNEAKKELLDTSEEEKYVVVLEKHNAIKRKEEELKRLEEKLHKREEGLKKRAKEAEQQVKELERQNRLLDKEVRELKPLQKEVAGVRSMLYHATEKPKTNELSLAEKREKLDKERIVFFGGHPNWIQKTKDSFPDARFLEVEDINRKLSFIKNYDVVCINTDHFNHGFYEKLMNELSRHDVKLVYIQGATNEERVVDMLYKGIYE